MAITIDNLRIIPYSQKNGIKPIFGDVMSLTFTLPQPYMAGDEYILGLDYDRVLIPTERPICALQDAFTVEQNNITFALAINTARFRDWVSTLKKPMPIWLQLARKRDGIWQTLLIDDVLAIPTIIDGSNLVFPGDPLDSRLAEKLDKPEAEGSAGQVLKLGDDGEPIWANGGGGPGGDVYWDDIQGKPDFATVATTGSYDDLTDKPTIPPAQVQADWTQSSTSAVDFIKNKPTLAAVATTGSYNDLSDTPTIPTDYVSTSAVGSAGGVAALDASGVVPPGQITLERPIITIPAATTAYTFGDGMIYQHSPSSAPTYTLPTVADTAMTHTVIITVSFANVLSLSFQDPVGSTIAPLSTPTVVAGTVVQYLCEYNALSSQWVIMPLVIVEGA